MPGDGGSLREVLDQGLMLLCTQVAARHQGYGGVLRPGGGGEWAAGVAGSVAASAASRWGDFMGFRG